VLSEDGVIFVQCDDNEQAYIKMLMHEIHGQVNFAAYFIWNHRKSSQNDVDVSLSPRATSRRFFIKVSQVE
jgi:adenine specific DNA methylase Mod